MTRSPESRAAAGRIGGHTTHARYGSDLIAARARRGLFAKFEREVDPDGVLDPAERACRAEHAQKAFMQRIALKSAAKRRKAA